jgi:predicted GH43/DUF377 family glycosyl hydrolase
VKNDNNISFNSSILLWKQQVLNLCKVVKQKWKEVKEVIEEKSMQHLTFNLRHEWKNI